MHKSALIAATALFLPGILHAEQSVCDLFKDLKASDGRQLTVSGELIISKDFAALGSADCEERYQTPIEVPRIRVFRAWPVAIHVRPSAVVLAKQIRQFHEAATEADRLRKTGEIVSASATFSGRLQLKGWQDLSAELTFDSFADLKVEALPDPSELPVIPICELFQNLPAWKGKRIAVRGESVSTMEGSWISGRCKSAFYTNGYR